MLEGLRDTGIRLKGDERILGSSDFVDRFKTARIWGRKVYDGQLVQRHHLLEDGDVVELRI